MRAFTASAFVEPFQVEGAELRMLMPAQRKNL